jgi:hypothetical protein
VSNSSPNDATAIKEVNVQCPAGYILSGGGVDINGTADDDSLAVQETYPSSDAIWHVRAAKIDTCNCGTDSQSWTVTAWAICIQPSPPSCATASAPPELPVTGTEKETQATFHLSQQ